MKMTFQEFKEVFKALVEKYHPKSDFYINPYDDGEFLAIAQFWNEGGGTIFVEYHSDFFILFSRESKDPDSKIVVQEMEDGNLILKMIEEFLK